MSQADVELIRSLIAPAEVDLVPVMRDDEIAGVLEEQTRHLFDAGFECALVGVGEKRRRGFSGLREIWLDWLEPWATYRAEEELVVDLGDGRVLWLGHDYGSRKDGLGEVVLLSSAIWTVRDGKVVEAVFYAKRDDALSVAGVAK